MRVATARRLSLAATRAAHERAVEIGRVVDQAGLPLDKAGFPSFSRRHRDTEYVQARWSAPSWRVLGLFLFAAPPTDPRTTPPVSASGTPFVSPAAERRGTCQTGVTLPVAGTLPGVTVVTKFRPQSLPILADRAEACDRCPAQVSNQPQQDARRRP
jgi:hypothetical protein